jgi:uncharacterized protein
VSSDITLLNQHGSQVLLGETLMVPIADSMVYLRPLYVAATTNPQPQLEYVIAVLGRTVKIDTSLSSVLSDVLQTTVTVPSENGVSSSGTVPAAVAGILQAAQTDYNAALNALKQGNLGQFQSELQAMDQQLQQAQQVLGTTSSGGGATATTTTTTTAPPSTKGTKTSKTGGSGGSTTTTSASTTSTTTAPTSAEPRGGSASTPSSSASAAFRG